MRWCKRQRINRYSRARGNSITNRSLRLRGAISRHHRDQPPVAHHYTEAGLVAQAIPYSAAGRAEELSNARPDVEAVSHLTKGLEALKNSVRHSRTLHQQNLRCKSPWGLRLMATKGFGAPEVSKRLRPSARAVPAGGRDPSALAGAAWDYEYFIQCGESYRRRMSWRSRSCVWPKAYKIQALSYRLILR